MAKTKKTPADSLGWDKIDNISKAAREAGLPDYIVHQRKKAGWTAAKALSTPVKKIASKKPKAAKKSTATLKPKQENLPKVTNPLGGRTVYMPGVGGVEESAVPGAIEPIISKPEIEALTARPEVPPVSKKGGDFMEGAKIAFGIAVILGLLFLLLEQAGFL